MLPGCACYQWDLRPVATLHRLEAMSILFFINKVKTIQETKQSTNFTMRSQRCVVVLGISHLLSQAVKIVRSLNTNKTSPGFLQPTSSGHLRKFRLWHFHMASFFSLEAAAQGNYLFIPQATRHIGLISKLKLECSHYHDEIN